MARFARQTERSGGAGRKGGEGEMNARPALAFAAAEFRANEVGAPLKSILYYPFTAFTATLLRTRKTQKAKTKMKIAVTK